MWNSIANSHLLSSRISKVCVCVYVHVRDPTQPTNISVKQKCNTWGKKNLHRKRQFCHINQAIALAIQCEQPL